MGAYLIYSFFLKACTCFENRANKVRSKALLKNIDSDWLLIEYYPMAVLVLFELYRVLSFVSCH